MYKNTDIRGSETDDVLGKRGYLLDIFTKCPMPFGKALCLFPIFWKNLMPFPYDALYFGKPYAFWKSFFLQEPIQ